MTKANSIIASSLNSVKPDYKYGDDATMFRVPTKSTTSMPAQDCGTGRTYVETFKRCMKIAIG